MQHYFKLELADPIGDGKEFGEADHHAYMQPTELLRVEGGASPSPALAKRIAHLRALFR